jgi:phosphatidylinositol alpha 1,6-mannosyltransferase
MYSKEPLRVAQFAGSMCRGQDGVTRVLYKLIDAMAEEGVESVFFSPILPPPSERPVAMHRVPSVPVPLNPEYRFSLPGYGYFEQELRRFRPDILHIHTPCSLGMAAVQYARKHHLPVVATYHTHFASYAKYYRIEALEGIGWNYLRGLYNRCQRTFVPSLPIMAELEARGLRHLANLPHGVDAEKFHPRFHSAEWRAHVSPEGKKILLFAGRLVWEKDLATLIGVYDRLLERRSDWVLVLAGDGPVRGELASAMPEAKLCGKLTSEELAVAYASSDIFVFPSTTETFGNVTLEAMASALVPICVREGGACGVVNDGVTGFVAPPRDVLAIAGRVEQLLDQSGMRKEMSGAALAYARSQRWEAIFRRLIAAYGEVIGEFPVTLPRAA